MRRWLVIAGAGIVGLLLLGFLGVLLLYPQIGAWAIESKLVPRLESKLGRTITIGHIDVKRGSVVLEDVLVQGALDTDPPLVHVARVHATFDFWDTFLGHIDIHEASVERARIHAERRTDGSDDVRDMLARLGFSRSAADGETGKTNAGSGLRRLRPDILNVDNASLAFIDRIAGVNVHVRDIDTSLPRQGTIDVRMAGVRGDTTFGPRANADAVYVATTLDDPVGNARVRVAGGQLSAFREISLSSIAGSVESTSTPGALRVNFSGSYGGSSEKLWQARGTVAPTSRTGSVRIEAERFALGRLSSILKGSMLVDFEDTEVGARMNVELQRGAVAFSGGFEVEDANIYHRMLADSPIRDIDIDGDITGRFDRRARTLTLERVHMRSRGVEYRMNGAFAMPGGIEPQTGVRRQYPRISTRLEIPPVPCQTMLDGIPRELIKYLGSYTLRGTFRSWIDLDIDWTDLKASDLDGYIGIHKCRVRREPTGEYSMDRLLESFTHQVEVGVDQWIKFTIGPENPDYVPIWDISPHLLNSLMTTEDSRFYEHNGFIVREFKSALIKNLQAGYFRYGASSITMQTVKNVILYREKTLSRKLQELFFTWHIENKLEKDRIFEIYVNAIEYGPGLYGIGPAARRYFGKHPRDLNPVESAFFSSILPSPKKRYMQYCDDRLTRWTTNKIQRIIRLMHKRERLDDAEYELAQKTPLVFDRQEALPQRQCRRQVKDAMENTRPTQPTE